MTVTATTRKAGPFNGNDVTTAFPFTFKVFASSDLQLTHTDADGVETVLTLDTHYSISLNADQDNNPGGTITYPATGGDLLATGEMLTAVGVLANEQSFDITNAGRFSAQSHENALDKGVILIQQLAEKVNRALLLPVTESSTDNLPAEDYRAGYYLAFDSEGNPVASSGTGSDSALRSDLAASGGAALVGFVQGASGAVARSVRTKLREFWSVTDFGVTGDGLTDDTEDLNFALAAAFDDGVKLYIPPGIYRYDEASPGAGYALYNPGASIIGQGRQSVIFAPLATMPNTADFMLINPTTDVSQLELAGFFVHPDYDGTVRGRRAIYMLFDSVSNLSKLHMHGLIIRPCNNYGVEISNDVATNLQGIPAYSRIEGNIFYDGVKAFGLGDSNVFHSNFHNTPAASGRHGLWLYHVDGGGGVSSHTMISGCAMSCDGASLRVDRARNIKFFHNNVEQAAGAGSNSAVIDINGSGGTIPVVEIKGNHFGVFGTTTVQKVVRINAANCAEVESNTFLSGIVLPSAIDITVAASDTYVGRNAMDTSKFTAPVTNAGTGTAGVQVTLPLSGGAAAAGAGYAAPAYFRDKENTVSLKGTISGAGIASGTQIATLPAAYAPAAIERFAVNATIGGASSPAVVEIASTGAVTYIGSGAATLISLAGIQFTTTPIVLSVS